MPKPKKAGCQHLRKLTIENPEQGQVHISSTESSYSTKASEVEVCLDCAKFRLFIGDDYGPWVSARSWHGWH